MRKHKLSLEKKVEVEDEYPDHTHRHLPYITSVVVGVNMPK